MTVLGQDRITVWFQPEGKGTPFKVLGVGENAAAMTGKTIPGPGRTPVYGRDRFGAPVVIKMQRDAPGDLPNATLQIYERGQVDFMQDALNRGCPLNVQTRIATCGNLSNPNNWDVIDHWGGGEITTYTPGDGPALEYGGEPLTAEASISFTHRIRLLKTELSELTAAGTSDYAYVDGVQDSGCDDCTAGYAGADKIMYAVGGGVASTTAPSTFYTKDGGSTWAATSASPATTEVEAGIAVGFLTRSQLRIIVGVGGTIEYATVTLGDEGTTTWTDASLGATAVESVAWLYFDGLFVGADGDIYKSEDQGESYTQVYTGSNAITNWAISWDESTVWAAGASGTILRSINGGAFTARTGPGANAFGALAVAGDGLLYAGYGTTLSVSSDDANTAGNWTELKDFGTNYSVVAIQVIGGDRAMGGDSQLLRVVVNDSVTPQGEVWESVDGGANFSMVTLLDNAGYNDAYFSAVDDNYAVVVGDINDDAYAEAQLLQPLS